MQKFEIKMPKLGESIEEATITKWFIKENDFVNEDQVLLEIATEKVDSEIPSPVSGKVIKILFNENEKVTVGTVIAIIDTESSAKTLSRNTIEISASDKLKDATMKSEAKRETEINSDIITTHFYSPLVKNIARQENINYSELEKIKGTGLNSRVKKDDLLKYIETYKRDTRASVNLIKSKTDEIVKPSINASAEDEIIEMDRVRKLIAGNMLMSKQVSPHVTNVLEADVTSLVIWREKHKDIIEKRENIKLTYMPEFIEAVSKSLKDFPMVNASVEGTKIILKKAINIGIAVALPTGNLIVPVIKNTDKLNLLGIALELNRLAENARNNKLKPDEIQGGTFTITNFGTFKNLFGTPIINQPQVAILGTGIIQKKPVVVETSKGDVIAIRHMMYLSLTYDHRIIDGSLGGSFLKNISEYFENWDVDRSI